MLWNLGWKPVYNNDPDESSLYKCMNSVRCKWWKHPDNSSPDYCNGGFRKGVDKCDIHCEINAFSYQTLMQMIWHSVAAVFPGVPCSSSDMVQTLQKDCPEYMGVVAE